MEWLYGVLLLVGVVFFMQMLEYHPWVTVGAPVAAFAVWCLYSDGTLKSWGFDPHVLGIIPAIFVLDCRGRRHQGFCTEEVVSPL